jgi:hypothetical protein
MVTEIHNLSKKENLEAPKSMGTLQFGIGENISRFSSDRYVTLSSWMIFLSTPRQRRSMRNI